MPEPMPRRRAAHSHAVRRAAPSTAARDARRVGAAALGEVGLAAAAPADGRRRTPGPACRPPGRGRGPRPWWRPRRRPSSPSAENSATTPGRAPSRPRTSEASARRSLPPTPSGAATATSATPSTSSAPSASAPAEDEHGVGAQLLQLLLGLPQPLHDAADPLGQLLRPGLELLGQLGDQHVLAGEEAERVEPDQRLDPPHAGADRGLRQQLDQAELPGAVHVGAAAQLAGVVADLDHAHRVAVLLAEQRHRADPAGLLLRGDERAHLVVVEQHGVDLVLDVGQHRGRDGAGRRGEVEAQPAGRVQRAGLGGGVAEGLAHPGVHEVGGRVRPGDRRPPAGVDLGLHGGVDAGPRRR